MRIRYIVGVIKPTYGGGRQTRFEEIRSRWFNRAEARVLSKHDLSNDALRMIFRSRASLRASFNRTADPEWTAGQKEHRWNKRIQEYYKKRGYTLRRDAGEPKDKRRASVYELYRVAEARAFAQYKASLPADEQEDATLNGWRRLKGKSPTRFGGKGNVKAQKARARTRAAAYRDGDTNSPRDTPHKSWLRQQIRTLEQTIAEQPGRAEQLRKQIAGIRLSLE